MSDNITRIEAARATIDKEIAAEAVVLHDVRTFIRRFCAFPDEHCLTAVTLWAAHTHMTDEFTTTPRLALLSPEAGSGKTRVLEVLDLLVPEPMLCLSASPAAIFRTLSDRQITLLFDEVDAIFSKRGKDDSNEDLRALLNAGYRRGATIPRCVGPRHDVQQFNVFCAAALAGLGSLPDTIMSRSIIIKMRRRAPNEVVEQFRLRQQETPGHQLRDRLARWADSVRVACGAAWPELPPGISDRPAEVWEPLLAVADAAGAEWPKLARAACVALTKVAQDRRTSLGVRLLTDLRTVFSDREGMHAIAIIEALRGMDEAPWAELQNEGLTTRILSNMLREYGIASKTVRVGQLVARGYTRSDLWDTWSRYLPPSGAAETVTSVTPVTPTSPVGNGQFHLGVTGVTVVTDSTARESAVDGEML
jgi:hypothetical protein